MAAADRMELVARRAVQHRGLEPGRIIADAKGGAGHPRLFPQRGTGDKRQAQSVACTVATAFITAAMRAAA